MHVSQSSPLAQMESPCQLQVVSAQCALNSREQQFLHCLLLYLIMFGVGLISPLAQVGKFSQCNNSRVCSMLRTGPTVSTGNDSDL